jgi:hypothetical protein
VFSVYPKFRKISLETKKFLLECSILWFQLNWLVGKVLFWCWFFFLFCVLFVIFFRVNYSEATFNDQEREDFYKQIPPLMVSFPHMWVVQQRIAAHNQQMMMMNQQAQAQAINQSIMANPEEKAKEIEALKKSGILSMMSSPEGRVAIQQFALKVQASKEKANEEVDSWNEEKKSQYFDSFLDHPLIRILEDPSITDEGSNPMNKINSLMNLSESELTDAMKMILVLSSGSVNIGEKLRGKEVETAEGETGEKAEKNTKLEETIRSLQITLGSMANLRPRTAASSSASSCPLPHDHSQNHHQGHDHGHSHAHGQQCPVHPSSSSSSGWDPLKPDVTRGKVDKMER